MVVNNLSPQIVPIDDVQKSARSSSRVTSRTEDLKIQKNDKTTGKHR